MKSLDSYKCRERIQFVDLAKFVGIFLMVLCHSGMQNLLTVIIYAFLCHCFFSCLDIYLIGIKIMMD